MIASFRRTLHDKGYIEVETPVLHVEAGGAHARPFLTHHNTLDMDMYLRIALELHLKRLIVGGMDRVFEIGRIFRNEGISTRHNPEFTMIELYEAFADHTEMMAISEELITNAARDALGHDRAPARRRPGGPGGAVAASAHDRPHRGSHRAPRAPLDDRAGDARDRCGARRRRRPRVGQRQDHRGAVRGHRRGRRSTDRRSSPAIPSRSRPLARVDRDDPYLTERFEFYMNAREIGNGYSELNDPVEQRLRFEQEQAAKDAGDLRGRHRRRGLPARAGVRPAADRRPRHRHRPRGDAARRRVLDQGSDPVPHAPTGGLLMTDPDPAARSNPSRSNPSRSNPSRSNPSRSSPSRSSRAWGDGVATVTPEGNVLDAWFPDVGTRRANRRRRTQLDRVGGRRRSTRRTAANPCP